MTNSGTRSKRANLAGFKEEFSSRNCSIVGSLRWRTRSLKLRGESMTGVGGRGIRPLGKLGYQIGPLQKSQITEPPTLESRGGSKLVDPGGFAYFIPLILKVALAWG